MTGTEALRRAVARLAAAGVPDPQRDARRLLAHALGAAPDRLTLILHDPLADAAIGRFETAVAARCRRQPVAQITGRRCFFGRAFRVTRDVLDPRPETEMLVAAALEEPAARILDLGTGTGCILLTLLSEWPDASGIGSDLSEPALEVARGNARTLGLDRRAAFVRSDWCDAIEGRFDLIVSNPPYIAAEEMAGLARDVREWEPALALSPGGDGLDAYRAVLAGLAPLALPGARVLLEIGPTQAGDVLALAGAAGLRGAAVLKDLDGRDRVVSLRMGD